MKKEILDILQRLTLISRLLIILLLIAIFFALIKFCTPPSKNTKSKVLLTHDVEAKFLDYLNCVNASVKVQIDNTTNQSVLLSINSFKNYKQALVDNRYSAWKNTVAKPISKIEFERYTQNLIDSMVVKAQTLSFQLPNCNYEK